MGHKPGFAFRSLGVWLLMGAAVLAPRAWWLLRQPYLLGPDAYYYALQIKFFTLTGAFKIADRSLLLPLMGWTGKLGLSCETVIILWSALIQFLAGLSLFAARRLYLGKTEPAGGFALLGCLLLSPALTLVCLIFPKYAFSLIFLPFWPAVLINPRYWSLTLISVLGAGFNHISMAGLSVLLFAVAFLRRQERWRVLAGRKWRWLGGLVLGLVLAVVMLRNPFLLSDWQRFDWHGLQPAIWTLLSREGISGLVKLEAGVSLGLLTGFLIWRRDLEVQKELLAFWLPLILFLSLVPLGSGEVMGMAERLTLLLPVTVLYVFSGKIKIDLPVKKAFLILEAGILLGVALFPQSYFQMLYPNNVNPDYAVYDQITRKIARLDIPMFIAHQGLNYYYKYRTLKESFPYAPEDHWPKTRIWRAAYGIHPAEWGYYLPERFGWGSGLLLELPGGYTLVREDVWQLFTRRVAQSAQDPDLRDRVFHSWRNPCQKRPAFSRERSREMKDEGEFSAYPKS